MREGLIFRYSFIYFPRITPACAGRTLFISKRQVCCQDHPRVCGKDPLSHKHRNQFSGSPPRVREGRGNYTYKFIFFRITPACAGRTAKFLLSGKNSEDHPRVCGKDKLRKGVIDMTAGSPPRVREGLSTPKTYYKNGRITPACAGRTYLGNCCSHASEDHPRVCGKNENYFTKFPTEQGSPPRVREEPKKDKLLFYKFRITPACAGRTPT